MDERTLWRFKTCAITITSPNQQGREGADSEEVWILTGKSVILLNRSSLNHGNSCLFPCKEAYFYACSLLARTSLRISWGSQRQDLWLQCRQYTGAPGTSRCALG